MTGAIRNLFIVFVITMSAGVGNKLMAQKLFSKVIYKDAKDSLLENPRALFCAGIDGSYCIDLDKYFVTPKGKLGPFPFIQFEASNTGNGSTVVNGPADKSPVYFHGDHSSKLWGPAKGIMKQQFNKNALYAMAITSSYNDSLLFYIGNKLVNEIPYDAYRDYDNWILFDKNDDKLYVIYHPGYDELYFNDKLIDTAGIIALHDLNDDGNFIYTTAKYLAKGDTTIPILNTVKVNGKTVLKNIDGLSQFSRHKPTVYDHGNFSVVTMDSLYLTHKHYVLSSFESADTDANGDSRESEIYIGNGRGFIAAAPKTKGWQINVNGTDKGFYNSMFLPTMDTLGNYSYFIMQNYFLYPVVNGVKQAPLTRYGVRAIPLNLSPKGDITCYYVTADSLYLYYNNTLLMPPMSKNHIFKCGAAVDYFSNYNQTQNQEKQVFVIIFDSTFYFLQNGKLSNGYSLFCAPDKYDPYEKDAVTEFGEFGSCHYYMLRRIEGGYVQLTVDGTDYEKIKGRDVIHTVVVNDKGIVFFIQNDHTVIQYSTYEN